MSQQTLSHNINVDNIEVVFAPELGEAWVTHTGHDVVDLPRVLSALRAVGPSTAARLAGATVVDYFPRPRNESVTGWWILASVTA